MELPKQHPLDLDQQRAHFRQLILWEKDALEDRYYIDNYVISRIAPRRRDKEKAFLNGRARMIQAQSVLAKLLEAFDETEERDINSYFSVVPTYHIPSEDLAEIMPHLTREDFISACKDGMTLFYRFLVPQDDLPFTPTFDQLLATFSSDDRPLFEHRAKSIHGLTVLRKTRIPGVDIKYKLKLGELIPEETCVRVQPLSLVREFQQIHNGM